MKFDDFQTTPAEELENAENQNLDDSLHMRGDICRTWCEIERKRLGPLYSAFRDGLNAIISGCIL